MHIIRVFRILKYLILGLAFLFALVLTGVNLPFSHRLITEKANAFFLRENLPVQVENISLLINGKIALSRTRIIKNSGDTLVYAEKIKVSVRIFPLLFKKVKVNSLILNDAIVHIRTDAATGKPDLAALFSQANKPAKTKKSGKKWDIQVNLINLKNIRFSYNDTVHGIHIDQSIGRFYVRFERFSLAGRQMDAAYVKLEKSAGGISLRPVVHKDTLKAKPSGNWKFQVGQSVLKDILFTLQQPANNQQLVFSLGKGGISEAGIDLSEHGISAAMLMLRDPEVHVFSSPLPGKPPDDRKKTSASGFPGLWKINAGDVKIRGGNLQNSKFEPDFPLSAGEKSLQIKQIHANLKDIRMDSRFSGFRMNRLAFILGSGFQLEKGQLTFLSDSMMRTLLTASLETRSSKINLSIESQKGLAEILRSYDSVPFTLDLHNTEISSNDVLAFLPKLKEPSSHAGMKDLRLRMKCRITGTVNSLTIEDLAMNTPSGFGLYAAGQLSGIKEPSTAACSLSFRTDTITRSQVEELMALTGTTVNVPGFESVKLQGTVDNTLITPEFTLTVLSGSGNLALEGSVDLRRKSYTLQMGYSGLELGKLFAISDLDRISGHLNIAGKEFNPANMQVKATIVIDSAEYRGYLYRNLRMNLEGDQGIYQMGFRTEDTSFACNLAGTAAYSDTLTMGQIAGTFNLDAGRLNLYSGVAAKGSLHIDAKLSPGRFNTAVTLGNLLLARENQAETLENFSLSFNSTDSAVNAKINSDFLQADFHVDGSLADLQNIFTQGRSRGVLVVDSVVGNKVPYISVMPEMSLTAESTYDPFIGLLLNDSVFSYDKIVLKLTKDTMDLTTAEISAENFHFAKNSGYGVTVNFEGHQEKTLLVVKADSIRSGNVSLAGLAADIAIEGDTAFFKINASDRHDRLLYDLAGAAYKYDQRIALITTQPQWILNGYQWQVAPGEFLVLEPENKDFKADLHWKNDQRGIDIYGTMKEKIFFECRHVGVNMLLIPGMNTFGYDGELSGTIDYQSNSRNEVGIQMDIQHMKLADMQLGQMTITGHYESDTLGNLEGELRTIMNDTSRLDLFVKFDGQDSQQSIRTDFTGIPLHYFESLLSKYISGLQGEVSGGMALTSIGNKPRLDGSIAIQNTTLRVVPLNARFYLSDDLIVFENNQLLFRDFLVMDSLKKRLHLNGAINLDEPRNITADLLITSDRLQVMNTTAKENPVFNGQVFVNSKISLTGTVQKPSITGNIALAEGTVINYSYMEDLSVSETEKTITFASLATDQQAGGPGPVSVNPWSNMPNIEASIEIDPRSLFTIQISRGFDIGVSINGGGFLNYGLMPNKTIQLNGTYEIEKGNAELKIPGWPRKDFIITPGSSLKWNGIVDDPELNLETTSKVRGSYLNPVDGKNREIDFMVYMKLAERLSQLEIVFDVRCEDQYITSVLNSMSTDERMRQAINMLIFNSIDLPNMTSSSDYVTQQINQFWESQFNQFTKSNIKKVDLSIGIDTYTGASKGGGEQEYTSLTYEVKKNIFNNRGSVLVSGYLNDNSAAGSQSNSMLENFIFEYALDTNRSKYLKVYRQQNYEDLLEGEVTKSGIGFVYRRSYNTLGEIWRRKKKKIQE